MKDYYHITTFGCAMNSSDSERVAAICEMMKYERTENIQDANLIIVNSCSIRQKAEDRVVGMGKKVAEIKLRNPEVRAILTGCMAARDLRQAKEEINTLHQDKYEYGLKKTMPWLDFIVEIKEIQDLPKILEKPVPVDISEYLSIKPKFQSNFLGYLPISTGCNKFCTYCIVPFTRGKEVYRSQEELNQEFVDMLHHNFKDITLLGQNVNSWRDTDDSYKPKDGEKDFAYLLEDTAKLGLEDGTEHWIRFTSSHPYDINLRLAEVIAEYPNIAKQVHFAMQSGDDEVLRRMNRHYKVEDFKEKVKYLRSTIPGVGVTTDIIVGFPGETEEEFKRTADVLKELQFDQVFISEFSNRKGTLADKFYKDDVPNDIKAKRKEILNEIVAEGNKYRNGLMLGSIQRILLYKNKRAAIGRTSNGKDVEITNVATLDKALELGKFYDVKITGTTNWSLKGEIGKLI